MFSYDWFSKYGLQKSDVIISTAILLAFVLVVAAIGKFIRKRTKKVVRSGPVKMSVFRGDGSGRSASISHDSVKSSSGTFPLSGVPPRLRSRSHSATSIGVPAGLLEKERKRVHIIRSR
ncbi:Uncharacterised protein at_DN2009 [Pycnogonum litorale]